MMDWLAGNLGTICAALALVTVIALITANLAKGESSCGCNCAHCALSGQCHKDE